MSPVRSQPSWNFALEPFVAVVGGRDPRAPDLELADRLAVPGQRLVTVVDDASLESREDRAGLLAHVEQRVPVEPPVATPRTGGAGERAGLGHAPDLQVLHPEIVVRLDERSGRGRSADEHEPQGGGVRAAVAVQREQRLPDRRHPGGERDLARLR
jgi:hypothetical protein